MVSLSIREIVETGIKENMNHLSPKSSFGIPVAILVIDRSREKGGAKTVLY